MRGEGSSVSAALLTRPSVIPTRLITLASVFVPVMKKMENDGLRRRKVIVLSSNNKEEDNIALPTIRDS